MNLLLWSLIADAVDYQAYLTGQRNDGTVYATITFIVFFAASASTSVIALLLEQSATMRHWDPWGSLRAFLSGSRC